MPRSPTACLKAGIRRTSAQETRSSILAKYAAMPLKTAINGKRMFSSFHTSNKDPILMQNSFVLERMFVFLLQ